ncbi:hypothetical protein, partial [Persicitalea sp.]|uniref:hypothetical protein n=1 Tax=Persicitalea sp. TaxID=3100273 RepID=UPI0035946C90
MKPFLPKILFVVFLFIIIKTPTDAQTLLGFDAPEAQKQTALEKQFDQQLKAENLRAHMKRM